MYQEDSFKTSQVVYAHTRSDEATSFDKMDLGPTKNMSKQPFLKKNARL